MRASVLPARASVPAAREDRQHASPPGSTLQGQAASGSPARSPRHPPSLGQLGALRAEQIAACARQRLTVTEVLAPTCTSGLPRPAKPDQACRGDVEQLRILRARRPGALTVLARRQFERLTRSWISERWT